MQVAPLAQRVGEDARHVRGAAERRRHAIPVEDGAAQRVLRRCRAVQRAGEADPRDGMDRHEVVAQRHPAVLERRVDADAFEAAEAEEVRHGLAHLRHRQRLPPAVCRRCRRAAGSVVSRPSMTSRTVPIGWPR